MTFEESLHDVTVREQQLERHILGSPEYLRRADRELKRQVSILYLAIALLLVIQGIYAFRVVGRHIPVVEGALISVTSLLAIINCLLLIRTKRCFHRLNEAWLAPHEREAFRTLKIRRKEIIIGTPQTSRDAIENAELN